MAYMAHSVIGAPGQSQNLCGHACTTPGLTQACGKPLGDIEVSDFSFVLLSPAS